MQKCIFKNKTLRLGTSRQNGALREPPPGRWMVSEGLPSGQGSLGEVLAAGLPGARPHRGAPGPHRPSTTASRPCPAPLQAPEDRRTAARSLRPGPSATLPDTDWLHSRMRKTRATGPISSPQFITDRLCGADTKHAEPLLGAPAFKRFL